MEDLMKRGDYTPLGGDKILDPLPDSALGGLGSREAYHQGHYQSSAPRRSRAKITIGLLLPFVLGITIGWLLNGMISPIMGGETEKSRDFASWFSYPFTGIRMEKRGASDGSTQGPKVLVLQPGDSVRASFGRESLRYLSLERSSSFFDSLRAKVLSPPQLYLEERPLETGVNVMELLEPERALLYTLYLKYSGKPEPQALFKLELEVSTQGWLKRADMLKQFEGKKTCLERALETDPENVEILMTLGKLHLSEADTKGATLRFQQAIVKQPRNVEARKLLGEIYREDQPKKALEVYKKLAELDVQGRIDHYRQIARIQEKLGIPSEDIYRKILAIQKDDPDAIRGIEGLYAEHVKKAQRLEKKGSLTLAIREMKKALEIQSPKSGRVYLASLYNNLGYVLAKKKKHKNAIKSYEASIKWDKNPITYLNLANAYAETNQVTKALRALEKAQALKPKDPNIARNLLLLWGELLVVKKDYPKAIEKFKALHASFPKDPHVVKALGMVYWKNGDLNDALATLNKLSPLLTSHSARERAETHRLLGDLHRMIGDRKKNLKERLGHIDLALESYKKAVALNGKDEEAQKHLEEVAAERKSLKIQILKSS
jgi:tetratricopeptide (TPR) repeat protein